MFRQQTIYEQLLPSKSCKTGTLIMLWWHTRIADAQLQDRLERLDLPVVKVYVAGCVTHARDVLAKAPATDPSDEFVGISNVIDRLWLEYPAALQAPVIDLLIAEAGHLLPGEGGRIDWEDAMIWATAYALAIIRRDQFSPDAAQEAHEALHQAYWSVFSYDHLEGDSFPSDDDVQAAEKSSSACKTEIEFHLDLLAAVETVKGQPPGYSTLLQQMDGRD